MQTKRKRKNRVSARTVPPKRQSLIPEIEAEREDQVRRALEERELKTPLRSLEGIPCPVCGAGVLALVDSLAVDWIRDGERTVVGNLVGFRCSNCGHKLFDAKSARTISQYIDKERPRGGYTATVSSLGGGKLGVYFPRDLLRNLDFSRNEVIHLYPISRKKVVIESAETQ